MEIHRCDQIGHSGNRNTDHTGDTEAEVPSNVKLDHVIDHSKLVANILGTSGEPTATYAWTVPLTSVDAMADPSNSPITTSTLSEAASKDLVERYGVRSVSRRITLSKYYEIALEPTDTHEKNGTKRENRRLVLPRHSRRAT